jgi:hypothetical protein
VTGLAGSLVLGWGVGEPLCCSGSAGCCREVFREGGEGGGGRYFQAQAQDEIKGGRAAFVLSVVSRWCGEKLCLSACGTCLIEKGGHV